MVPRVLDEIPDNQEIIHVAHIFNDAQLIFQSFLQRAVIVRITLLQAVETNLVQIFPGGITLWHVVLGKLRHAELNLHIAALRNLRRILNGLRRIGKESRHLLRRFHIILAALVAHPVLIRQLLSGLNTEQNIVGLHILRIGVMDIIGSHKRNIQLLAHAYQGLVYDFLFRQAVVLKLQKIISLSKDLFIFEGRLFGLLIEALHNIPLHLSCQAGA